MVCVMHYCTYLRVCVLQFACLKCVYLCVCEAPFSVGQKQWNLSDYICLYKRTGCVCVCVCVCVWERERVCVCACVLELVRVCKREKLHGGGKGGGRGGGKKGRQRLALSPLPLLCLLHTLIPSPRARLASHWLNPQLYIYVIGQGGVYILSVGRLNLATSFKTFKQSRQTERQWVARSKWRRGIELWTNRSTAHSKQELLSFEKKSEWRKERGRVIVDHFQGENPAPQRVCFLFLSFSSSPFSQISMLCFGICAPNPSNSSIDLFLCHLKHFELQIVSRTLQPNKLRQTFAGFHLD